MKSWNCCVQGALLAVMLSGAFTGVLAREEVLPASNMDVSESDLGESGFGQCVDSLRQRALQERISPKVIESQLSAVQYVARVIELDRRQPEFTETFHNYLGQRVNEQRITRGRQLLKQHYPLLLELTREYGIPPQYLVAFWGLETNFGSYLGKMNVLDSLATLACDPRRSEFFTLELMEALRLVEAGVADHETMLGSWAGAMGNMQFMPSAYRRYALDADGDNKADLWRSLPDAFTSAAHFLNKLGWQRDLRWGREVRLPRGFDYALAGRDVRKPLAQWRKLGIRDIHGNLMPSLSLPASVIIPSGHKGPAFVVYQNFDVIMGWNRSEYYALAVGHLADRINGGGALETSPPDDERLTIETVKGIQEALNAAGYDAGAADGIFGTRTKRALRDLQKANGWVADGYPSPAVMEQLKLMAPTAEQATQGSSLDPVSLDDLSLRGELQQGGMVIGKAPAGAQVEYDKRQLALTERGEFVLGFGRDEALDQTLILILSDGRRKALPFTLAKREYNLQRIEGVPAQTVNPDQKHLARIGKEAGEVKVARNADTDLKGFLQQFNWPVQGPVTGVYGSQRIYNGEPRRPHFGVDIAAPKGAEIMAPADGVVSLAHRDMFFSGGTMVIDHGHGISTSYLHMSKLLVKSGVVVKQGQVIGLVGATGRATGPHLCWRLNWYQERLDPQLLIASPK